ncbi:MAG TPA: acetylglutamate kinase [Candidatus Altiarchaeales archaeon]|nr:acetylglutamate kinase [Candidatus Altiarchaeales archaeon]
MEELRSEILIDALNYIKQFRNKVFIVKLGGEVLVDEKVVKSVAQDLIFLNMVGIKTAVVHGGGADITNAMEKFGKKPKFVEGLRVTDKETMDIVEMVLTGKNNTQLVSTISKLGGDPVGLSGKSGHLFEAKKKKQKVDLGLVGEITKVNPAIVQAQIQNNYIPIISPIGIGADGESLNINADTSASELAVSLNASKLILMTAVDGVLDKNGKLIKRLTVPETKKLLDTDVITGGMTPKLKACIHALENGVERTHIIKAGYHALLEEILTVTGTGTMITQKKVIGE